MDKSFPGGGGAAQAVHDGPAQPGFRNGFRHEDVYKRQGVELPCAMIVTPRTPSRGLPPTESAAVSYTHLPLSLPSGRDPTCAFFMHFLHRKEVIQPQVPLRLLCYDFIPVTSLTLGPCLLAVGFRYFGCDRLPSVSYTHLMAGRTCSQDVEAPGNTPSLWTKFSCQ